MSALRPSLLFLLASLASCGGAGELPDVEHVQHLDLRLEDGRALADVIDPEPQVLEQWALSGPDSAAEEFGPWVVQNAVFLEPRGASGVRLHIAEYDKAAGKTHITLAHADGVDTTLVDVLELDVDLAEPGLAVLLWRDKASGTSYRLDTATSRGPGRIRFELAGHPGWKGEANLLRVYPAERGSQSYDVRGLRWLAGGLHWGAEPHTDGGDLGLLGFAGDLRRTWGADLDVPLYASISAVPGSGRLSFDAGLPRMPAGCSSVTFRVDARTESGEWTQLLSHEVADAGNAWQPAQLALDKYVGEAMQFRFRVLREAGSTPEAAAPQAALAWWGAPQVAAAQPKPKRPHLVLITLDTLRQDHLGTYGGSVPTPHIDSLADTGLVFEEAWSAANSTLPSHASLLTGLDVPGHGVADNRSTLAEGVRTLAEALRERGYQTAAAVSVHHLQAGYSGLGRGFDRYLDVQPGSLKDGAKTLDALDGWFDDWGQGGSGPVFLWVHLFDPHTPYVPPAAFMDEYRQACLDAGQVLPEPLIDLASMADNRWSKPGEFLAPVNNRAYVDFLYDAGVAYTDRLVGRLMSGLERCGVADQAAIALTADHGESLGENGVWYDHEGLFPPVLRVPLLLRVPGGPTGRIDARVGNFELARTLLDLAGPGLGRGGQLNTVGDDLMQLARDGAAADRPVFFAGASLLELGLNDGVAHHIQQGKNSKKPDPAQLFLLEGDPDCLVDQTAMRPALAERYRARTLAWFAERSTGVRAKAQTSRAQEAQLDALGYGGGDEDEEPAPVKDPESAHEE
ncbi:MAG: arylsulfatase [Planctomycetota bacterium]|jgi:arylsulfatase